MEIAAVVLYYIVAVAGVVLVFLTGVGTLVILVDSLVLGAVTGFRIVGPGEILMLCGLYAAGEIFEYVMVMVGARKTGASKKAAAGGIIGGIAGGGAGLLLGAAGVFAGTLAGIFLGVFAVEMLDRKGFWRSLKAGAGGVAGRFSAVLVKLAIAAVMLVIVSMSIINYY